MGATSSTFVPVNPPKSSKVVIKNPLDGHEVDFTAAAKSNNGAPSSGPRLPAKEPSSIVATPVTCTKRLEPLEPPKNCIADEEKVKAKAEAGRKRQQEKQKRWEKAQAEEEEKRRKLQEEQEEHLREEEEEKERTQVEQETEKKRRIKEKRKRAKERKCIEAEEEQKRLAEDLEIQQHQQEAAEKEWLYLEAEDAAKAREHPHSPAESEPVPAVEEGGINEVEKPEENDLSGIRQPVSPAWPSALMTARNIENLDSVLYPEGINGPKPELNQSAEKGKFR